MNQKRIITIAGFIFLIIYFLAALLLIVNFQMDIKAENTQQLKLM
ncbi:MAG TPA: hypothetical protein VMD02_04765 [Candidatus Omnitrophota bacterium]|nr:hypothetical protein [Candidatus Omnitrophota bacterium]